MSKLTTQCCLWTFWATLALSGLSSRAEATEQIGNKFETAPTISLDQLYRGTLPIAQGRQCLKVDVPEGKRVNIQGSNNYGTVFFSAYSNKGNILIGETQVLASFQNNGVVETEENDGTVMVCIDSDTAHRREDHRYSVKVSLLGTSSNTIASAQVPRTQSAVTYAGSKSRKVEAEKVMVSPYTESNLQLVANSRSFPTGRDGDTSGDAGNNAATARRVALNQMYSGYLNASRNDDRDCYTYSNLPNGSQLQVSVANNDGILGMSAYRDDGKILIGQVYMVKQQALLETEAASGNVMLCVDTDGEKSDHQYTFEAKLKN